MSAEQLWIGLGLFGNALFFSRWVVQWLASERAGASVIPTAFWFFSIGGSVILLTYAVHKGDPVFILSQLPNCIIYFRNLHLLKRARASGAVP